MEFHSECVHVLHEVRIEPIRSEILYAVVVLKTPYVGLFCAAQSRGRVHQSLEYFLKIESRATDDFQHIGSGGLLFQRVPPSAPTQNHDFMPFRQCVWQRSWQHLAYFG